MPAEWVSRNGTRIAWEGRADVAAARGWRRVGEDRPDYERLQKADLVQLAEQAGHETEGTKADLIARLTGETTAGE